MFRKTIQNIETNRTTTNQPQYYQQQVPTGQMTQRYQRYLPPQQELKPSQRKNISSGQFSQLKKIQPNKTPELVIRQCDPTELNHYKKPIRPMEDNIYQYQGPNSNSSNKKERITINPRKNYDSNNFKEPLQEVLFSDRENRPDRYSSGFQLYEIQQQIQTLKQFMLHIQNEQSIQMKKIKNSLTQVGDSCNMGLDTIAQQASTSLNKQRQDVLKINKLLIENQTETRHLREQFFAFVKDNQEKMESLVLQMNGSNVKKSKNNEEFGVDLKSSSQFISGGVGTSMSVNFQNDNINLKLYNETSAQLQMLKAQLEQCKQKIQLIQKDTKILQLEKKSSKQQVKQSVKEKIDLKEVQKMVIEKFSQERKKNSFSEKIQDLSLKTKDLYKVYQDMDGNIKGMNDEFARVLNGTIIKKEKMLQAKLLVAEERINELTQKTSPQSLIQSIKPQIQSHVQTILQQKSSLMKVIKVRQPNAQQKSKLQSLKGSQYSYMMDEQGHLIDATGSYIVQTLQNGSKQRVKIEKNLLYLLQCQGVEIIKQC